MCFINPLRLYAPPNREHLDTHALGNFLLHVFSKHPRGNGKNDFFTKWTCVRKCILITKETREIVFLLFERKGE